MNGERLIVEQFVMQFPSAAAWLIVTFLGAMGVGLGLLARKFLERMDVQDATLNDIKLLLASEIGKLREMHHDIDRRVVRLESLQDAEGPKWGRRARDNGSGNHGG